MRAVATIKTDYLVVGAGAAGMAFTDALITASDARVVMVDRRHAPGGHWNEAYPFVRLHQPSALYGVNSLPLGRAAIDRDGLNKGLYELAGGPEICAYYDRVMRERLLASGQVRYFPMSEHLGGGRFVSRLSGEEREVRVRKRLVDARYLEPAVPATSPPPFEVAPGARCAPAGELPALAGGAGRYVIIGAGKTAVDACLWLLGAGAPPESIRWVKPREAWLWNRAYLQAGELVGRMFEGFSLQIGAVAQARSMADLFARLEAAQQLLRVDASVTPGMYKGATVTAAEIEQLRRIDDVVRLGHVRRVERDRISLDGGDIPTSPDSLHVHCAAPGLNPAPAVPVFTEDRVTLQALLPGFLSFCSAFLGYVEATREDTDGKNGLCPPNPLADVPQDWLSGMLAATNSTFRWGQEPDIQEWLEGARLYHLRGLGRHSGEPHVQQAEQRLAATIGPALDNHQRLLSPAPA